MVMAKDTRITTEQLSELIKIRNEHRKLTAEVAVLSARFDQVTVELLGDLDVDIVSHSINLITGQVTPHG